MQDFVPKEIAELIDAVRARQDSREQARRNADEAEAERLGRIHRLRMEREEDLRADCRTIRDWIERFDRTVGPAIWRLSDGGGSIVIFSAKFWRGEPILEDDGRARAQLRLHPPGIYKRERYVYEEVRSQMMGQNIVQIPAVSISHLWLKAHPDFVTQCAAHLSGPDAWSHVHADLKRRY